MYTERADSKIYAFLLFLIWPFLSLIIAIKEYKHVWAKNVIWSFTAFFAYTKVDAPGYYSDAVGYRMSFENFAKEGTFHDFINSLYVERTVDVLQPFLEYFVSRFTDNYQIYFLIIGISYGYFYSRNIWFILEKVTSKLQFTSIIILVIFLLIIPIWNLGGFRFYLAAHVFIFGVFKYILSNNKNGLLILGLTFLIHFSFIIPISIVFGYLILKNRITLYFLFFILSTLFSEIAQNNIKNNSGYLPEVFEERVNIYTSEASFEMKENAFKGNWYLEFSSKTIKYSSMLFLIILYWKRKSYMQTDTWLFSLCSFTLLFYGAANMIGGIPSVGRFLAIAQMLSFATLFLSLQNYNGKYLLRTIYLASPFLLVFFIVQMRKGFDVFGLSTIFGNPLTAIFLDENYPLIDYIKGLIM